MKKVATRVRLGNVICSAAKNPDGSPIWKLCKDGSIALGVKTEGNATVQSLAISASIRLGQAIALLELDR
jgi:hypothetical protein